MPRGRKTQTPRSLRRAGPTHTARLENGRSVFITPVSDLSFRDPGSRYDAPDGTYIRDDGTPVEVITIHEIRKTQREPRTHTRKGNTYHLDK